MRRPPRLVFSRFFLSGGLARLSTIAGYMPFFIAIVTLDGLFVRRLGRTFRRCPSLRRIAISPRFLLIFAAVVVPRECLRRMLRGTIAPVFRTSSVYEVGFPSRHSRRRFFDPLSTPS